MRARLQYSATAFLSNALPQDSLVTGRVARFGDLVGEQSRRPFGDGVGRPAWRAVGDERDPGAVHGVGNGLRGRIADPRAGVLVADRVEHERDLDGVAGAESVIGVGIGVIGVGIGAGIGVGSGAVTGAWNGTKAP